MKNTVFFYLFVITSNVLFAQGGAQQQKCIATATYSKGQLSDSSVFIYNTDRPTTCLKDGLYGVLSGLSILCDTTKSYANGSVQPKISNTYLYDAQQRLISAQSFNNGNNVPTIESYTYNTTGVVTQYTSSYYDFAGGLIIYKNILRNDEGAILRDSSYYYNSSQQYPSISRTANEYNSSGQKTRSAELTNSNSASIYETIVYKKYNSLSDLGPYMDSSVSYIDNQLYAGPGGHKYTYDPSWKILTDSTINFNTGVVSSVLSYSYPTTLSRERLYYLLKAGSLQYNGKTTTTYNADNQVLLEEQTEFQSGVEYLAYQNRWTYNPDGYQLSHTTYRKQDPNSAQYLYETSSYNRNLANNPTSFIFKQFAYANHSIPSTDLNHYYYYNTYTTTGINSTISPEDICVYPVPAKNQINVRFNKPTDKVVTLTVFSMDGKILLWKSTKQDNESIDINAFPVGTYELIINGENNVTVYKRRIVKQ